MYLLATLVFVSCANRPEIPTSTVSAIFFQQEKPLAQVQSQVPKVAKGMNAKAVLELLGTPHVAMNQKWEYWPESVTANEFAETVEVRFDPAGLAVSADKGFISIGANR
jgi:outer membrane protein assembly factor BamE (lipoprotein component of BamABCDE complex)